jgi:signal transduction histidine kinase
LTAKEAELKLPVTIRGVVTSAPARYVNGLTIQDGTRGIYVNLENIPFWIAPAESEFWEVEGHTGPGNFAPVVVADKMTRINNGQLPEPAHPSWNQLINGNMDVQWGEFQGLVTAVQSNFLTMLMPEGSLKVQTEDYDEHDLSRLKNAVIRLRGLILANWNPDTREVVVGSLRMENASISVDRPAPTDISDAAPKSIHDLLLFDAQASAFQRVKITGQIVHAGSEQMYLQQGDSGLRILSVEAFPTNIQTGDIISAVGYPTIAGPSPTLHDTFVTKIAHADLPAPRILNKSDLKNIRLDSLLVRIDAKLNGWHREGNSVVLEMQTSSQPFFARLENGDELRSFPRIGSRLDLVGVYLAQGGDQRMENKADTFELLLNSPTDIVIRSEPSWWTLQRLLVLVTVLMLTLASTSIWITQLRRQVEQRTAQLHRQIHERELAERARALEAERARIARDLHDDLGSSLAEIAMLAKSQPLHNDGKAGFPALLDAITDRARGLIAALDVIVWAVDPEENSLQSLADYFSGFAEDYLSNCGIACRFEIPISFPAIALDGRLRHDLFLAVKEVLHNIVRHSRASEVQFVMALADGLFEITIADNGTGFETDVEHGRHGMKNLAGRLAKLGGTCRIDSRIGAGTAIKIQLQLPPAGGGLSKN